MEFIHFVFNIIIRIHSLVSSSYHQSPGFTHGPVSNANSQIKCFFCNSYPDISLNPVRKRQWVREWVRRILLLLVEVVSQSSSCFAKGLSDCLLCLSLSGWLAGWLTNQTTGPDVVQVIYQIPNKSSLVNWTIIITPESKSSGLHQCLRISSYKSNVA